MAEEMDMMGERMPAGDQVSLKSGMPEEARQSLLSSDENIQAVLISAVENQGNMENEDDMMPRDMGALGNM